MKRDHSKMHLNDMLRVDLCIQLNQAGNARQSQEEKCFGFWKRKTFLPCKSRSCSVVHVNQPESCTTYSVHTYAPDCTGKGITFTLNWYINVLLPTLSLMISYITKPTQEKVPFIHLAICALSSSENSVQHRWDDDVISD